MLILTTVLTSPTIKALLGILWLVLHMYLWDFVTFVLASVVVSNWSVWCWGCFLLELRFFSRGIRNFMKQAIILVCYGMSFLLVKHFLWHIMWVINYLWLRNNHSLPIYKFLLFHQVTTICLLLLYHILNMLFGLVKRLALFRINHLI